MVNQPELDRLLALPWTVLREQTPDGDVVLRVKEIPSATGTGVNDEEREAELWESLTQSLSAYLHFGDSVPVPTDSPRFVRQAPSLKVASEPVWTAPIEKQTSGL